MLKKLLLSLLVLSSTTMLIAAENTKKNKSVMTNDLIIVPFPGGKMFKSGKIKLSDEQKKQIATIVRPIMHGKYSPLVQEMFLLEKSIRRTIAKQDTIFDARLQDKLDRIATLKQEAIEYKIEALTKLKSIFTEEQWQVWISN